MNPIYELCLQRQFERWDVPAQYELRNKILALEIPGLIDVQFHLEGSSARVTPVFATEQDYAWYQLKYVNTL